MDKFEDKREEAMQVLNGDTDNNVVGDAGGEANVNNDDSTTSDASDTNNNEQTSNANDVGMAEQAAQAASVAETAAQTAAESNMQVQQLQQQLQQAMETNQHLQDTIRQQNEIQQEQILKNTIPELDIDRLTFEDEETRKAMLEEYSNSMRDYVKSDIMREMEPALMMAREAQSNREKNDVISALKNIPEMQGIEGMIPQMDAIIKNNAKMFDGLSTEDKYINAYAIARGVNAINTPAKAEPTAEEIVNMLNNNPDALALLEKQRVNAVKDNQNVPAMSAGSGAGNVPLTPPPEKPKTWDEARSLARKLFGRS